MATRKNEKGKVMSEKEKLELENKLEQIREWITANAETITKCGFSVVYNFTSTEMKNVHAVWAGRGNDIAQILSSNNAEFLHEAENDDQLRASFAFLTDHLVNAYDREKNK